MTHFPRTLIGAAIAAVLASPGIVWAQSADATLRGKAPANSRRHRTERRNRRDPPHADGRGRQLHARRPPARHVPRRCGPGFRNDGHADRRLHGNARSHGEQRRGRGARRTVAGSHGDGTASERSPHLGSRHDGFATTDRDRAADHAQLPRVRRHRSRGRRSKSTPRGALRSVAARRTKTASTCTSTALARRVTCARASAARRATRRAIRSHSSPSANTRSSRRTTRPSTTRSRARRSPRSRAPAPTTFEAQAFATYSADNFRAKTPGEINSGRKTESETKEYGLAIGGPIIQDKLHFFFTYEAKRYETPTTVLPGGVAPDADRRRVAGQCRWRSSAPRRSNSKRTCSSPSSSLDATDSDRFELSAKIRDEVSEGDQTGTGVAASAAVDTNNDDKRFEVSWKHSGDRWLNELQFTYEDAFFVPHISNAGINGAVYTWFDGQRPQHPGQSTAPIRAPARTRARKGWAIANNITFTDITWFGGDHTIKTGVKYKDVDLTAQDAVRQQPGVLLRRDPGGRRHHSLEGGVRAAAGGFRFHGGLE